MTELLTTANARYELTAATYLNLAQQDLRGVRLLGYRFLLSGIPALAKAADDQAAKVQPQLALAGQAAQAPEMQARIKQAEPLLLRYTNGLHAVMAAGLALRSLLDEADTIAGTANAADRCAARRGARRPEHDRTALGGDGRDHASP